MHIQKEFSGWRFSHLSVVLAIVYGKKPVMQFMHVMHVMQACMGRPVGTSGGGQLNTMRTDVHIFHLTGKLIGNDVLIWMVADKT
jgi:hypothetical protein